jgi:uroporphyrinogen decarboxylase
MQIAFTPEFAERLSQSFDFAEHIDHNPHGGGNSYELERALGQDMLLTSVGWANSYYQENSDYYTDEWGVGWQSAYYNTPYGVGRYTEMVDFPLAEDSAIDSYIPPDPTRPELYSDSKVTLKNFQDEYWIVGVTVTTIFETAWALRGLEQLLMDFVLDPDLANRILDIPHEYHLTAAKHLTELGVDMIWLGDDMGAQNGMLISPELWRQLFKPRMADMISQLKSINPRLKVAYHSDGNIEPIIPELIEVGVDVLNPVQPGPLNPEQLKRDYGNRLCFWGSMDEQRTLPFGTPEDVRSEVLTRLRTLGRGGGLILGPTHHVQLDTPLDNFWAMVKSIRETRYESVTG